MFLLLLFNLSRNPMDLSEIYTVKIVIRFGLGHRFFRGDLNLLTSTFLLLFPGAVIARLYLSKLKVVQ